MQNTPQTHLFERLVQKFDPQSKLIRAWELTGGISARITALEIEDAQGGTKKMVVRQHGPGDLADNPDVARDEYHLLTILQKHSIAAPKPYALDTSCEIFPTPVLVIEFIEGQTDFTLTNIPHKMTVLAEALAAVHAIDVSNENLSFLPPQPERVVKRIHEFVPSSEVEARVHTTLKNAWPRLQTANPPTLLHGDYWPGNVMWHEGQFAVVIDWEDAAIGDPLSDLAIGRLEILWAFGSEVMQLFTHHYQELRSGVDFAPLPYWDLWAALRPMGKFTTWAENEAKAQHMIEQHHWFIHQAFERLA